MIRRLSLYGYRTWRKHMRHIGAAGIQRGFASDASIRRKTTDDPSASEVEEFLSTEYTPTIPCDEALRKLQTLIGINAKGEYQESWDQAWDYYQNLDEDLRTADIRPVSYTHLTLPTKRIV